MSDIVTSNAWEDNCLPHPKWAPPIPNFAFSILLLQMLAVFSVSQTLHFLILKRIGCPTIVSQLLAGLILGKSVLGKYEAGSKKVYLPMGAKVNNDIEMLSYVFSMFIVAVKMDYTIMKKTGRIASAIGLLVLAGSMCATITTRILVSTGPDDPGLNFTTSYISVTSFPVVAVLLRELGILNSEVGRITLSAVLVAEIVCICVMLFNNTIAPAWGHAYGMEQAAFSVFTILSLIILVIYVMRPLQRLMIRMTPQGKPIKEIYVSLCFLMMLMGSIWTDLGKQFVMLGAYIVGAGVLDGPPVGSTIVDKLDTLITGILQPYLIASCTMNVDVFVINMNNNAPRTIAFVSLSMVLAKVVVCLLCGYFSKILVRDSIAIAFLMSTKGFIDVVSYKWWFDLKNISEDTYATMEILCLLSAIVFPMGVKLIYDPVKKYAGYQIRDIMHCKPNCDLRILPCIFRAENVTAIIKFLEFSCPTMDGRSIIYPLHLMKMVGRSQPVFISHDMQKKKDMSRYYSQEIVFAFKKFEMANSKSISVHSYTAMSPPEGMYEEICNLAVDKVVSLILLPFHRRYGYNGCIDRDDHQQQLININVLARPPCSVAILVDRNSQRYSNYENENNEGFYSVCVIFIGGQDDRETLAYAKRMRFGMRIKLKVVRFVALGNEEGLSAHDVVALSDVKEACNEANKMTTYEEVIVRDGPAMALELRSMMMNCEYDLVMVGRRYGVISLETSGLEQWSEVPELGIIGDLLASDEVKCKTTVLVVQQQLYINVD